jgi:hypothetical protein
VDRTYDEVGWVSELLSPDPEEFRGTARQGALALCLVWLTVEEFSRRCLA